MLTHARIAHNRKNFKIPNEVRIRTVAWNHDKVLKLVKINHIDRSRKEGAEHTSHTSQVSDWIACGGEKGFLKVFRTDNFIKARPPPTRFTNLLPPPSTRQTIPSRGAFSVLSSLLARSPPGPFFPVP